MADRTTKLLFAARLQRTCAAQSRKHEHADFWQAEYSLNGPIHYQIDGHTLPLPEGAFLLIPPGHSHQQDSPQGADSYLLKFRFPSPPVPIAEPMIVQLTGAERQLAERILTSLIYEHDGRADGRGDMIAALLAQLLILAGRWSKSLSTECHPPRGADARQRVRLVADMLRREHTQNFSITALAKRACLSRSQFLHLFRAELDASPLTFHTRVRMEKAVELARYTGMSWRQIAAHLGYDDPAYFSRAFKKIMGASPSKFPP
ncbi:MAG: helix-turn-helix domain-containing protein [Planctomycetes bacterium]|nr:helix-turn-helix domain-containing protein [Planctomycetota bacterium]